MLSTPFQNSDLFHRTEVVADQRSADIAKQNAAATHAQHSTRSQERKREETVEATEETALEHDREGEGQPQGRSRKRKTTEDQKDENNPLMKKHLLSPGHVDLTA